MDLAALKKMLSGGSIAEQVKTAGMFMEQIYVHLNAANENAVAIAQRLDAAEEQSKRVEVALRQLADIETRNHLLLLEIVRALPSPTPAEGNASDVHVNGLADHPV